MDSGCGQERSGARRSEAGPAQHSAVAARTHSHEVSRKCAGGLRAGGLEWGQAELNSSAQGQRNARASAKSRLGHEELFPGSSEQRSGALTIGTGGPSVGAPRWVWRTGPAPAGLPSCTMLPRLPCSAFSADARTRDFDPGRSYLGRRQGCVGRPWQGWNVLELWQLPASAGAWDGLWSHLSGSWF